MLFRYFILIFFLFFSVLAVADNTESDTIRMRGLTIHGDYYEKFSPGSIHVLADSIDLLTFAAYNLNDLLTYRNPVYFKSYGSGMLSSVSFRGTGASHTAVLWNGVNINSPTLGQSDFSLFPVLAFDQVRLVYGSASSRYGSDAIGGGILLDSKPEWGTRVSGRIGQYAGSFRNILSHIDYRVRTGKRMLLSGKFYRQKSANDFEFENVTKPGKPVERQQNAAFYRYGFLQDIFVNTSDKSQLSLKSWFNFTDREIQPTMVNDDAEENQKDKNFRLAVDYGLHTRAGYFALKSAYLWDYMLYNNASEISTAQYIGQFAYENHIKAWEVRAGVNFNHIRAEVENYMDHTAENRVDLYAGIVNQALKKTQLSINFRQTFVKGFSAPFSPSIGVEYDLLETRKSLMFISGQASLNYRVPTLNDRYWVPGGRIDLKPEYSRNLDASLNYSYKSRVKVDTRLSGYIYDVDNWIMWVPGPSYWIPENVRRVGAYGLEFMMEVEMTMGRVHSSLHGNFGFTRSVIKASTMEDDPGIGNQLPYTPVMVGGIEYSGSVEKWSFSITSQFTGKRYVTSDNESVLPTYGLMDLRAGRTIEIRNQHLILDFRINNLLNADYQNMKFRAMPGRNYMLGIIIMFNK